MHGLLFISIFNTTAYQPTTVSKMLISFVVRLLKVTKWGTCLTSTELTG